MQFVPPEKQERIFRQRVKQNADNILIGTVLAKYMLLKTFHIPFSEQHIDYGLYGKPYLRDYPNAHFNISHSGQFVGCAVSKHPVGIDIQEIVYYRRDVAQHICSPNELLQIETSSEPSAEFTKIWTQKEAYLKMLGTGIFKELREVVLLEKSAAQTARYMNIFISVQSSNI